jgi:hypothetical protein
MTTTHKLRKDYHMLTVVERVNLVLAARERGDDAEVRALEEYCFSYKVDEYEMRMILLTHTASMLAIQLLAREALIFRRLADHINAQEDAPTPDRPHPDTTATPDRRHPDPTAAPDCHHPDGTTAPEPVYGDEVLTSLLERVAATWLGFSAWCRDVGHDPHHVLRLAPIGWDDQDPAFFLIHQQIELSEKWAHEWIRDPDRVERWRDVFTQGAGLDSRTS